MNSTRNCFFNVLYYGIGFTVQENVFSVLNNGYLRTMGVLVSHILCPLWIVLFFLQSGLCNIIRVCGHLYK